MLFLTSILCSKVCSFCHPKALSSLGFVYPRGLELSTCTGAYQEAEAIFFAFSIEMLNELNCHIPFTSILTLQELHFSLKCSLNYFSTLYVAPALCATLLENP